MTTEGKKGGKGPRRLVSIRLDEDDVARIDALAAGSPLALDRSALIRGCLRIGLDAAERDPGLLVRRGSPSTRAPSRPGGKGRASR